MYIDSYHLGGAKGPASDAHWGCMMRVGQMAIANAWASIAFAKGMVEANKFTFIRSAVEY